MELKKKIIIGLIVIFVLVTGIVYCFSTSPVAEERVVFSAVNTTVNPISSFTPEEESEKKPNAVQETEQTEIYVYICGEVKKPGVYALEFGNRIVDAVEAAGGFGKNAAEEYLNLAMQLTDGEKIYVPSKQEAARGSGQMTAENQVLGETVNEKTDQNKVNLNTASKDQLMTLQGIGESKAEKILSYRESEGKFRSIEDIMNIEGIKTGVFDKIKDFISVE